MSNSYREELSDTFKDLQHENNFENFIKMDSLLRLDLIQKAVEKVQNGNYEGLDFNN